MTDRLGSVRRVLLLGGTSEIGAAIVRRLDIPPGGSVVLAGRRADSLERAAERLRRQLPGVAVETTPFYAEELTEHEALLDRVFSEPVDVVIPAFGVLPDQTRAEREPLYAAEVLLINTVAPIAVLLAAAQRLRRQGYGAVLVLSSIAGVRPRRPNFLYGASKAGLDAAGRGLAAALHGTGVRVVVVRPGFVIGRMTSGMRPAPLSTTADAVAVATVRALRTGDDVVWIPRLMRLVAIGFRVLPGPVWRRLPR